MGCNYYAETQSPCPCCKREYPQLHIGKSSVGWNFALCIYPELEINTLEDWKNYLQDKQIVDEYGKIISLDQLLDTITNRSHPMGLRRHEIQSLCVGHGKGTYDYMLGDFS